MNRLQKQESEAEVALCRIRADVDQETAKKQLLEVQAKNSQLQSGMEGAGEAQKVGMEGAGGAQLKSGMERGTRVAQKVGAQACNHERIRAVGGKSSNHDRILVVNEGTRRRQETMLMLCDMSIHAHAKNRKKDLLRARLLKGIVRRAVHGSRPSPHR